MTESPELDPILQTIAEQHLGTMLAEPDEHCGEITQEQMKQALAAAFEAGKAQGNEGTARASLLFRRLMESLPDHVFFKDLESRFITMNHSLAHFFGLQHPDEAIGKTDFDFFQQTFAQAKYDAEQRIIETGEGWNFREERDLQSGGQEKWVVTTKLPLWDLDGEICGTFGLARDITDHKLAELEVDRQRRLLETIIQILPCRIFVRDTEGKFLLINEEYCHVFGLQDRREAIGRTLAELCPKSPQLERIENEDKAIIESGQPIHNNVDFDQSLLREKRWVLSSKVPLKEPNGTIKGVVGMTLDVSEQKEAENRARAARDALQARNKHIEAELRVARKLQKQLMSRGFDDRDLYSKKSENWSLEASYLYQPSDHLAGDFFYLIPISEQRLGVLVCDVMGHGVKAALVTMLIRGLMLETPVLLAEPELVLKQLNDRLVPLAEDPNFPRFVTAVYTVIDLNAGEIRIANAGHPAPVWRINDAEGTHFEPCPVKSVGPALGLIENEVFKGSRFSLIQKTEILFFTDGIIEQRTQSGEEFGVANLERTVLDHDCEELPIQLKALTEALKDSAGNQDLSDDVCIIAVRLVPAETERE